MEECSSSTARDAVSAHSPSTSHQSEQPLQGPDFSSQPHDDDDGHHMCRVCRSDEGALYYPCLCTGSIKYVHQECLVQWLKYSKKEVCELCNYKYSFQPIYRPDMPKALPVVEILKGVLTSIWRVVKTWLLYTIVLCAWVGVVPLTAARIYNAVFSANIHNIISLPLQLFNTEHIVGDCIKGLLLLAIFVCTFISLVWLREQIIHGGPQEWLQLDFVGEERAENGDERRRRRRAQRARVAEDIQDGAAPSPVVEPAQENEHHAPVLGNPELVLDTPSFSGEPSTSADAVRASSPSPEASEDDDDTIPIPEGEDGSEYSIDYTVSSPDASSDSDTDSAFGDENAAENGNAEAEANANGGQEDGWRDWDRLGDELTWQRLVGLDGSFVFIEHVFWVIALNTLFTVLFAFSPYKLGSWILTVSGLRDKISYFPSIAAILTGYLTVSIMVFVLHRTCGFFRIKSLYRLLGIVFLVLKVFLLVLMEIGFFPIMCGWWMDVCSLSLFHVSLSSRLNNFSSSPTSSLFMHWMIGMIYVFYSASFVLLLREVLRPGVLWFMRNLNDPEFNPIMEMIELPVMRHLRRLVASTSLFFMAILLIVYFPLRIIGKCLPNVLPYNLSITAETPLSELSLELLVLQIVLPALLEQTSARSLLKRVVRAWCVIVGRVLNLDRYLLSDNQPAEDGQERDRRNEDRDAQQAADEAAPEVLGGGGGLAAEHQALLLLREPQTFEPYVRPPMFALRIVLLVIALATTATICSTIGFIVPVSVGRSLVYLLSGSRNVHELYTISFGLYVCWFTTKAMLICYGLLRQGSAFVTNLLKTAMRTAARLLMVLIPAVLIIPYLIGLSFQLIVVAPLRVGVEQTPIYFPWQEWAMGVLHTKIFVAAVMMGPEWWLKNSFEQIYQHGLLGLQVGFIYREVLLPVLVLLAMQIAAPFALAHTLISVIEPSDEEAVILLRFSYPFCLSVMVITFFVVWQINKLNALAQHIRNEKYLVGTQLVNYERSTVPTEDGSGNTTESLEHIKAE